MAIVVHCSACGRTFHAPNHLRGITRRCPQCHKRVLIEGEHSPDFDVFISHAHADQMVADRVCAVLESAGLRCWIAPRNIPPGAKWAASIMSAIDDVRVMVLICSRHVNNSDYVLREVERAATKKVPLLSFRIDKGEMASGLEFFFSAAQQVDASTGAVERHIPRLIPGVRALVKERELARLSMATTESEVMPKIPAPPHRPMGAAMARWATRHQEELPALLAATLVLLVIVVCLVAGLVAHLTAKPSTPTLPIEPSIAPSATETSATSSPSPPPMSNTQTWARPESRPSFRNSIGMTMVLIPAGDFLMGSPAHYAGASWQEERQHRVRITRPFYLGAHEVTVGQFRGFAEDSVCKTRAEVLKESRTWANPGWPQEVDEPVVNVGWNDAEQFCEWLSRKEGKRYRLPTEAEWECACRGGGSTPWSFGDDSSQLGKYAWWGANSLQKPHRVGQKKANAWGLYDMHGNVAEWCADWYADDFYRQSPRDDPTGPSSGEQRVLRGGSCNDNLPDWFRSAYRFPPIVHGPADRRLGPNGFRVAMDATP